MLFKKNDEALMTAGPAKQRNSDNAPIRSVIDPWLRIMGNLEGEGELQIDGHIQGDIRCSQLLVGKAATVDGNITADQVVVRGKVNGVIRGNRVILQEGALVRSEIFIRDNPMEELVAVAAGTKADAMANFKARETEAEALLMP